MTKTAETRQSVHAPVVRLSELLLYLGGGHGVVGSFACNHTKNLLKVCAPRILRELSSRGRHINKSRAISGRLFRALYSDPRAGLAPHRASYGLPGGN